MANAFTLFGVIKIDTSGFESKLKKATSDLKTTEKQLDKTEQASRRASAGISRVGQSSSAVSSSVSNFTNYLTALGSGALLATAGYAIKTATSFDSLKRALAAVSGSTEAATAQLARLKEVAKSPGLGFREAIQGSVNLQAAGLSAKTAEDALMAFGNALATVGKGKAELDGVIQALSQIQSKGKVSAEEIMQLAERLPQIRVAMQNAFGTADTEKLQDMGMKSQEFIEKIIKEFEKLPKVVGGAQNSFDNFKDAAEQAIAPLGDMILAKLTPAMDELGKELSKDRPDLLAAAKQLGARLGQEVGNGLAEGVKKLPDLSKIIQDQIIPPEGTVPIWQVFGRSLIGALYNGLKSIDIKQFWASIQSSGMMMMPQMVVAFYQAGYNAIAGFINGIRAQLPSVASIASEIGRVAVAATKLSLLIQSPSKVFFAIGKDVAQGFIDGIESMKTGIYAAMAGVLDISKIKGLGKKDAAGVSLLTDLIKELDQLTPRTKLQEVQALMTSKALSQVHKALKEAIFLAATELTQIKQKAQAMDALIERYDRFAQVLQKIDDIDHSGMGRGDQTGGLLSNGLGGGAQPLIDANPFEKFASAIPAIKAQWSDFWATMNERIAYFKSTLPSIKQSIGENLLSSMYAIGDVFANAVANWDGTAKGFFKSLAAGFKQMVGQIIGELVRLMVIKAIMNIIGAVAGGSYTPSAGAGSAAGMLGNGLASGGFVSGSGTGTSDSIPAMLSNGEFVINAQAVKKWGAGFFEGLNSMTAPLALAGGGMVGGGATYNQQQYSSPSITINMPSSGNGGLTRDQVERAVLVALNKTQNRNR